MRGTLHAVGGQAGHGRDHPRVCGEHGAWYSGHASLMGSSPRVRGTLQTSRRSGARPGIIPACAGNTDTSRPFSATRRDHPRVCGEHFRALHLPGTLRGSSPRVRGTQIDELLAVLDVGIIPACAGNTQTNGSWIREFGDHPRVCGEHDEHRERHGDEVGSSPRVRGTRQPARLRRGRHRIIPACAGNTPWRSARPSADGDHPRVCGEHAVPVTCNDPSLGSSPRVRGTLYGYMAVAATNGDHPRVCGEHRCALVNHIPRWGSSPRVRGTHPVHRILTDPPGIIPACAGNTDPLH